MGQCVGPFIWSSAHISGLHPPARIQPTVAATLWLWLHAFIFTLSAVDTLCAGGPFILLCLKGNSDDILG